MTGEKKSSLADRVVSLKKAGIPTIWTMVIGVASAPGISEFFDKTEDDALKAIKKAYPVLVGEVEYLNREIGRQEKYNELLYHEIGKLNSRIDTMMVNSVISSSARISPTKTSISSPVELSGSSDKKKKGGLSSKPGSMGEESDAGVKKERGEPEYSQLPKLDSLIEE